MQHHQGAKPENKGCNHRKQQIKITQRVMLSRNPTLFTVIFHFQDFHPTTNKISAENFWGPAGLDQEPARRLQERQQVDTSHQWVRFKDCHRQEEIHELKA